MGLAIDTEMVISACVMDLDFYLLAFDVLCAPVHVQHGRLVLLRELIVQIVVDQARFSDRGVTHEDQFDLLAAIADGDLLGRRRLDLFCGWLLRNRLRILTLEPRIIRSLC